MSAQQQKESKAPQASTPKQTHVIYPFTLFGAAATGIGTGVSCTGKFMPHHHLNPQAVMGWAIAAAVGALIMGIDLCMAYKNGSKDPAKKAETQQAIKTNLWLALGIIIFSGLMAAGITAVSLSPSSGPVPIGG